jgi:hypothetical protein
MRVLPQARYFLADPDDPSYGLTPLEFAPSPQSPWRALFDDDAIAAHLARLAANQQHDGGWEVAWEPPSEAARLEWRGILTVTNLRVLRAYGLL